MLISLDMSLRSTGFVKLDKDDNLLDYGIIKTDKDSFPFDEEMIVYVIKKISSLIDDKTKNIVIEGLSLNSKSSKKDVIFGLYWTLRTYLYEEYPYIKVGTVPVLSWRNWYTTKEERKFSKENCHKGRHLKDVVWIKHPEDIKKKFLLYVEEQIQKEIELGIDKNNRTKIDAVYDLSDAYALGLYRNSLDKK